MCDRYFAIAAVQVLFRGSLRTGGPEDQRGIAGPRRLYAYYATNNYLMYR